MSYIGPVDEQGRPVAITPIGAMVARDARRQERRQRARHLRGVEYHPPQETRGTRAAAARPWDLSRFIIPEGRLSREARLLCAGSGPPAQGTEPQLLACRVDWLTVAFKVEFWPKFMADLAARLDVDEQERVAVTIGELTMSTMWYGPPAVPATT